VLSRAGYVGLNFAFIGGFRAYHTPLDIIDNLDRRSLTHHGVNMLALARRFGAAKLPLPREGESIYFNAVGAWLVHYPAGFMWPLTALVMLLLALALRGGVRRGRLRTLGLIGGFATWLLATAISTGLGIGMTHGALTLLDGYRHGTWGNSQHDSLFFSALALQAVAISCTTARIASRWCSVDELAIGAMLWWTALLLGASLWLPGATGLLTWVAVPGLAAFGLAYARAAHSAPRVGVYLACAVPALAALAPVEHLLFQGMTLGMSAVGLPLVVLTAALLWPVVHRVQAALAAGAGGLALLLWTLGLVL